MTRDSGDSAGRRLYRMGCRVAGLVRAAAARDRDGVPSPPARRRGWADDAEREALEALVLVRPARGLADAAVQALALVRIAEDLDAARLARDDEAAERALWQVERVARSIFDVAAAEAGIDPADLAADHYLRPAPELWPEEDTAFSAALALAEADARALVERPEPSPAMLRAGVQVSGVGTAMLRRIWAAMARAAGEERAP